jgi:hypothetical protein
MKWNKWDNDNEMMGFTEIDSISTDDGLVAMVGSRTTKLTNEQNITNPQYLYDIELLIKVLKRLRKRDVQYVSLHTTEHNKDPGVPLIVFREGFTVGIVAPRCPVEESENEP